MAEPRGADLVAVPERRLVELTSEEALELLAGVGYGRVVFTLKALPAIRPINHVVDGGRIIIRTRLTTGISAVAAPDTVVAYEADEIDPVRRLGWSVVATGIARPVDDRDEVERLERLLQPWVSLDMDAVIAIQPEVVTGFRLVGPA